MASRFRERPCFLVRMRRMLGRMFPGGWPWLLLSMGWQGEGELGALVQGGKWEGGARRRAPQVPCCCCAMSALPPCARAAGARGAGGEGGGREGGRRDAVKGKGGGEDVASANRVGPIYPGRVVILIPHPH
jgi:hypothetical protein